MLPAKMKAPNLAKLLRESQTHKPEPSLLLLLRCFFLRARFSIRKLLCESHSGVTQYTLALAESLMGLWRSLQFLPKFKATSVSTHFTLKYFQIEQDYIDNKKNRHLKTKKKVKKKVPISKQTSIRCDIWTRVILESHYKINTGCIMISIFSSVFYLRFI